MNILFYVTAFSQRLIYRSLLQKQNTDRLSKHLPILPTAKEKKKSQLATIGKKRKALERIENEFV